MTDKEKKSKIADVLLEFYEEYQCNIPNRPMIPSLYASKIIDSLQEEPVSKTPADVESAMQEVEDKSRAFTEAHKGENADDILAQMRGEEPVCSVWHDEDEEPCEDRQVLISLSGNCYVDFYHKEDKRFYMFGNPKHYLCEIDKWAYIDDIIKLSNVRRTTKNCKEPVSKVWHDVSETPSIFGTYLLIHEGGWCVARYYGKEVPTGNTTGWVEISNNIFVEHPQKWLDLRDVLPKTK